VSQSCRSGRSGGGWTSYSNFHPRQRCSNSIRRHWRTFFPCSTRCKELPPTMRRRRLRLRRSPNITNRPSSHRPMPRTQSSAKDHRHRCRGRTYNPTSFTAPPATPNPTSRGETPSKLFPLHSDAMFHIILSVRASHFFFCFAGDVNSACKPSIWREKCLLRPSRRRKVSVVDDDDCGGGGSLRRLRATLPRR
jgi:hypothetical protein